MRTREFLHNAVNRGTDLVMQVPAMRRREVRRLLAKPYELCLETTSDCNADCIMCPRKSMRRPMQMMSRDLYEKVVAEAQAWRIPLLALQFYGDPLMMSDEDLWFYLSTARRCRRVTLSTNGQLLNERKAEIILRARVDLIEVDLDAADKETFERIRVNCKYETVAENIRRFVRLRKKIHGRTRVLLGCVVMSENREQLAEIMRQWEGTVDGWAFGRIYNRAGALVKLGEPPPEVSGSPCYLPWWQMVVASDGSVPLCCNDWDSTHPLGNVRDQTLKSLWQGARLREVREAMVNGDASRLPGVCRKCDYWDARSPQWWRSSRPSDFACS